MIFGFELFVSYHFPLRNYISLFYIFLQIQLENLQFLLFPFVQSCSCCLLNSNHKVLKMSPFQLLVKGS